MNFKIRDAVRSDAKTIVQLTRELAEYEQLADQVSVTEALILQNGFDQHQYFSAVIAETDQEIAVGYALYFYKYSTFTGKPTLFLEDLFIRASYRNRGCGKAMIEHLARIAAGKDCARMEWAVLDWNENAIKFYETLGAIMLEDWRTMRLDTEAISLIVKNT